METQLQLWLHHIAKMLMLHVALICFLSNFNITAIDKPAIVLASTQKIITLNPLSWCTGTKQFFVKNSYTSLAIAVSTCILLPLLYRNKTIRQWAYNAKLYVEYGVVDPNSLDKHYGWTALWLAAGYDIKTVKKLLQHPYIDPNVPSKYGCTPLHRAVRDGGVENTRELLRHPKTDPNIKDNYGRTPLAKAIEEYIEEYLDNGKDKKIKIIQELLLSPKTNPNIVDNRTSISTLHVLHREGEREKMIQKLLLQHPKINPNIQSDNGHTPLYIKAFWDNSEGLKALLQHPKTNPNIRNDNGNTPLYAAISQKNFPTKEINIEILLENGANPLVTNGRDKIIDLAKKWDRSEELIDLLIDYVQFYTLIQKRKVGDIAQKFYSIDKNSTTLIKQFRLYINNCLNQYIPINAHVKVLHALYTESNGLELYTKWQTAMELLFPDEQHRKKTLHAIEQQINFGTYHNHFDLLIKYN